MDKFLVDFDDAEEILYSDEKCDEKGQECQEFYIIKDNKCSKCLNGEYKCIRCKEYFTTEKHSKCTNCKLYDEYDVDKMTLVDVINLPDSIFKSELMTANLAELYNSCKNIRNYRHKLLVNNTEFNLLKHLCSGKYSGEIFAILDGKANFPAVILPASFANQLLDEIVKGPDERWRYEHAIASFVLDIWNIQDGQILACYYKNTGTLVRCPNDIGTLIGLWNRLIENSFSRNSLINTL